jgi:hypothetical protein
MNGPENGSSAKFVVSSATCISRERIFSSAKLEKPGSHRWLEVLLMNLPRTLSKNPENNDKDF